MTIGNGVLVFLSILIIYVIYLGIKIVPQSKVFVIERFGKFTRILESGLSIIVPFIDRVAFKVDILDKNDETGKWEWWEVGECRYYGNWVMLYLKNPATLRFDYFNVKE